MIFFNFRADRARQLTQALAFDDSRFDGFERPCRPAVSVTTMTEYDATYGLPIAFDPPSFSGNVAEVLASAGPDQPAPGRDREVRPRHLLLQQRRGTAVRRGRPHPGALAQGSHLRPCSRR